MKFFVLSALLIIVGCDVKDEIVESEVSEVIRFEPAAMPDEEITRINAICDALATKAERLPSLISSPFTFSFSEKGCEDTQMGIETLENVTIQKPNLNYIFRKGNQDSFAFPNVETNIHGAMSEICANTNGLSSPVQTSSRGAMWFTTFSSQKDCAPSADTLCIHIKKGELVKDESYSIHTHEWIKFKVGTDKTGFFTERKLISSANCNAGKYFQRNARLK